MTAALTITSDTAAPSDDQRRRQFATAGTLGLGLDGTIHPVRDDVANPLVRDLGFLAFGVVLIVVGFALRRGNPLDARG